MRNYRSWRFSRDYGPPYDPYAVPYSDAPRYRYLPDRFAFDEGYRRGRRDGQDFSDWQFSYQMGTTSYLQAMETGVKAFRAGDYSLAAKQFVLAASLNQGDAACRLHAAHAMVALGRYDEAALTTRRALQLQPKIAFLLLDIRGQYADPNDFAAHYQKLKETTEKTANDGNLWFLLGFYQFFSDRATEAFRSLQKADALQPGDRTTQGLLNAAKLSTPAEPPAPQSRPAAQARPAGQSV
jgi:tetratricopeptide (TPR) repeat protein